MKNKFVRNALVFFAIFTMTITGAMADTLEKAKTTGKFTLAYRESSIPFSYLGEDGKPLGFGWEMCKLIAEEVKKQSGRKDLVVESQAVTSQNRIPLIQNGTVDVECGSTTNNSERGKQVTFAINYFYTGTRFLVKADSGIKSINDLKGKKVVSTTGTTNYQILRNLNDEKKYGFELLGAKDHADALLMVESGMANAFGMDDILLYGLKASSKESAKLAVVGESIQVEPYAIMFRKDDPKFQALVNKVITNSIKTGEFAKAYKKWFQTNIPPKNVNLNAPMNKELKDNLKALSDKPAL
jgi:ABC-type amino acid transport substrate-binding protein